MTSQALAPVSLEQEHQSGVMAIARLSDAEFKQQTQLMKTGIERLNHLVDEVMEKGVDIGVIPGTKKPTLLLPGAEKLCFIAKFVPRFRVDRHIGERNKDGEWVTPPISYVVTCSLHMGHENGPVVADGVGACNAWEAKYRYRSGQRECPKCHATGTVLRSKKEDADGTRGWFCWNKPERGFKGCGANFAEDDPEITEQIVGRIQNEDPFDQENCVTPDTRILTHDLRWVRAGDIQTGDVLIGVQEEMDDQYARCFALGTATVHGVKEDDVYEVVFEDGRVVRCNGEHRWLARKVGLKGTEWVATYDIYREIVERRGRPRRWSIMSVCRPWDEDASREAGYIGGLLDADGCLSVIGQLGVLFAQQDNIVLNRMECALEARGFRTSKYATKTAERLDRSVHKKQVYCLRVLGGLSEQLRILGIIRPPRLLEAWLYRFDLSRRRLEGRGSGAGRPAQIKSVRFVGTEEIVQLGSSCGTYIAEGLVCHNTYVKMAKKRAYVDAAKTATMGSGRLTQDEEHTGDAAQSSDAPRKQAVGEAQKLLFSTARQRGITKVGDLLEAVGTAVKRKLEKLEDITVQDCSATLDLWAWQDRKQDDNGSRAEEVEEPAETDAPQETKASVGDVTGADKDDDTTNWHEKLFSVASYIEKLFDDPPRKVLHEGSGARIWLVDREALDAIGCEGSVLVDKLTDEQAKTAAQCLQEVARKHEAARGR